MHFSSPSGHRLSWCRPWNRGAVGNFSSGYMTVSTFWNIVLKVTPNPLIEPRKSATGDLLRAASGTVVAGYPGQHRLAGTGRADAVVMRKIHGRSRERGPARRLLVGMLAARLRPGR